MEVVTVSPKFQVVLPRLVRKALNIQPGQKLQVICYDNRVEMILVRPMPTALGFLPGLDTSVEREADRF